MLVDYHMHTPLCLHAEGTPEEYCERALERGIPEIGFSDHGPMPAWYDPASRMSLGQYPRYIEMVREVQLKFEGRLTIKLGLEADYFPGTEEFVKETLRRYEFDYVIGSVHFLGTWGFDNPRYAEEFRRRDLWEVYTEYYAQVEQLAQSRLFDILGHADVVKKFGYVPERDTTLLMKRAVEALKDNDLCFEINTSGLRKPCKEIYPARAFVEVAAKAGVPVTLGSDSHEPGTVGADYDRALRLLKECGYKRIARFTRRKRELVAL